MKTIFLVATLLALAVSPFVVPAGANHSANCVGNVTTVASPDGSVVLYVDDRDLVNGNGLWIYQESNGVEGLQQGGESLLGDRDSCQHADPDTLIF
jgi:hypothetical protein